MASCQILLQFRHMQTKCISLPVSWRPSDFFSICHWLHLSQSSLYSRGKFAVDINQHLTVVFPISSLEVKAKELMLLLYKRCLIIFWFSCIPLVVILSTLPNMFCSILIFFPIINIVDLLPTYCSFCCYLGLEFPYPSQNHWRSINILCLIFW